MRGRSTETSKLSSSEKSFLKYLHPNLLFKKCLVAITILPSYFCIESADIPEIRMLAKEAFFFEFWNGYLFMHIKVLAEFLKAQSRCCGTGKRGRHAKL